MLIHLQHETLMYLIILSEEFLPEKLAKHFCILPPPPFKTLELPLYWCNMGKSIKGSIYVIKWFNDFIFKCFGSVGQK